VVFRRERGLLPRVERPSPLTIGSATRVVELDHRRRISLGKIWRHSRYLVHEEDDGTIILQPAVVMNEAEARFMANAELVAQIEDNPPHSDRGHSRPVRRA
jgi:hypothetical protein